ncbi:MAG: hypothetical protein A3D96_02835 [Chlamydiae bacterium RIFCSPHIGHO2_12_FULL_44_59]|nr:MAG: hypothetical protein A2796_07185 [Chlamydiae bacterium RIFCSPHIGHO2_01_FULL_44_39]OGN56912.1 MAG: hypothetical protein A3C42_00355 [Chlamydiae bacterium RIFCSPHIGHO2_02_FULL_45_9]OGN61017.1 MAG: hypothetical protein A3D96_02835 [Chlamydiae bacterium RIFCSPHIGHO2_12_FULL_44_59]OGN66793.1 MAG: hypothetical protein A2978_00320 [Chlamydiae bacterium RIFCSPLOWO2_01_FULL_44_52]OGN69987.1 MAG: hypothetical protein A3I67_01635 [Chlamydiae bacterium RIFCSPLOWO2_02_FULL_45_22]OGN71058.1 MAG: hyp
MSNVIDPITSLAIDSAYMAGKAECKDSFQVYYLNSLIFFRERFAKISSNTLSYLKKLKTYVHKIPVSKELIFDLDEQHSNFAEQTENIQEEKAWVVVHKEIAGFTRSKAILVAIWSGFLSTGLKAGQKILPCLITASSKPEEKPPSSALFSPSLPDVPNIPSSCPWNGIHGMGCHLVPEVSIEPLHSDSIGNHLIESITIRGEQQAAEHIQNIAYTQVQDKIQQAQVKAKNFLSNTCCVHISPEFQDAVQRIFRRHTSSCLQSFCSGVNALKSCLMLSLTTIHAYTTRACLRLV